MNQRTHLTARPASRPLHLRTGLDHPGVQWLMLSAAPVLLLWGLQAHLMAFWQWLISAWSLVLDLSVNTRLSAQGDALLWTATGDGSFAPSLANIGATAALTAVVWLASDRLSDRFHPLKISLRALCLIQWSACLFFWLTPASFPYTISSHANALMGMGWGFMFAIGPLLALGWGILRMPLWHKFMAPVAVLAYFALMLPHKTLLQVWMLEHLSILFMPLLFLCFGALLDLWIFVALYAWLASHTPALAQADSAAALGLHHSAHPPLGPLSRRAP